MPKLNKSTIDALAPAGRDLWTWDSTLPGFGVRAQASGRKTFIARYRTRDGQQRKLTIARCCDMTPDQARELARKAFAEAAAGGDPAKQRADARAAPLMAELQDRYMRLHANPYKKPSSARQDARNWRRFILPALGQKKVDAVTKQDVLALHGSLSATPVTANHVRALLSKAMNLAIDWGMRTQPNPCIGVKRFRVRQRERVLTPAEMARLHQHLPPGPVGDLVRLLALTGCRLSEILTARRAWVDTQRRLLLLPDSKVGQRRIALPAAAMAIIEAMPENEWLIPGRRPGTHMEKPYGSWYKATKAAGLAGLRFHDLRHSFGSLGHMAGLSQRQIADMLGHASLATTERYLHGYQDDAARGVDVVSARITEAWKDPTCK